MLTKIFKAIAKPFTLFVGLFRKPPAPQPEHPPVHAFLSDEFSGRLGTRIDITNWRENIRKRHATRNKILVSVGTISSLEIPFYDLDTRYEAEGSDLALEVATSFTEDDIGPHMYLAAHQPRWNRLTEGTNPLYDTYLPAAPLVVAAPLDARSNNQGNGNRPMECLNNMTTDPSLVRSLCRLGDESISAFREFHTTRSNLISLRALGGGSLPAHQFLVAHLERSLSVAYTYDCMVLPSADEGIAMRNARGVIAEMLAHHTPRKILRLFLFNHHEGEHETDWAACGGMLTFASSLPGGSDSTTTFENVLEHGDLVVMYPLRLEIPLTLIGERRLSRRPEEWRGRVLPDSDAGGRYVNMIMEAAASLVAEDPNCYHVVAALGPFLRQDVVDLKTNGQSLLAEGQVRFLVNPVKPPITKDGRSAICSVVDFRVYRQVPLALVDYLFHGGFQSKGHGVNRRELVDMLGPSPEREQAREINERVARLARDRRS